MYTNIRVLKTILFIFLITGFINTVFSQSNNHNIIFILADDMGWTGTQIEMLENDASTNSDYYATPELAEMASQGMLFSQAYAPAPKCSPSRNSILTGQSTASNRFTNTTTSVIYGKALIGPSSDVSIADDKITFPELIKELDSDYTTAHFGKWHLGSGGPDNHGFDQSDGNTSNLAAQESGDAENDPKKMFSITNSAIDFMKNARNAGQPFYVQLSHYAVHSPTERKNDTYASHPDPSGSLHLDKNYSSMTHDLDSTIGILRDFMVDWGMEDSTYIVFLSDNGASKTESDNAPLAEGKVYLNEGGIRVPFIIEGPGITANKRSSVPVVGYDLYPTFIDWLFGNTNDVGDEVEGVSLNSIVDLTNGTPTGARGDAIFFHSPHYDAPATKVPRTAAVKGHEKIIVDFEAGEYYLYDLNSDIGESAAAQTGSGYDEPLFVELRDYLLDVVAELPTIGENADEDSDGMNDGWEFRMLLTTDHDETGDADADGINNYDEYLAGTDPLKSGAQSTDGFVKAIQPAFAYQGETGVDVHLNFYNPSSPDTLILIQLGDMVATDIYFNNGYVSAIFNIPVDEVIGNKDLTITYPNGSTLSMANAFEIKAKTYGGNIVYVDAARTSGKRDGLSWSTAFGDLTRAINKTNAAGGGELWLKAGTYYPDSGSPENTIILRSGVHLYGGFDGGEVIRSDRDPAANVTIISGDLNKDGAISTGDAYHVLRGANDVVLDGFTITGGNAVGSMEYRLGGGMYNSNTSPLINNCIFENNYAEEGGAMYNVGEEAMPLINASIFDNNSAKKGGAIVCRSGAHAYIENTDFTNNTAEWRGGAVFIDYGADPVIIGGKIHDNACTDGNGAGVYIDDNASQLDGTDPIFKDVIISSNSASFRGAGLSAYSNASMPVLYGCTFSNNAAQEGGGAIAVDNGVHIRLKSCSYGANTSTNGSSKIDNDGSCEVEQN